MIVRRMARVPVILYMSANSIIDADTTFQERGFVQGECLCDSPFAGVFVLVWARVRVKGMNVLVVASCQIEQ